MAEMKKATTVKPVAKEETVAQEVKVAAPVAEEAKEPEKKQEVKAAKATAKKTTAKKTATRKTTTKKAAAEAEPVAKKATKKAVKQVINLQFGGKSYSIEDLQKIAGDVWKYDLHKNDEEYASLELYVKPEENIAYYVFNGDITGSFFI